MVLTEKQINLDNSVVDGTPSENHSLQKICMEILRLRDDHGNSTKIRWMISMLVKI